MKHSDIPTFKPSSLLALSAMTDPDSPAPTITRLYFFSSPFMPAVDIYWYLSSIYEWSYPPSKMWKMHNVNSSLLKLAEYKWQSDLWTPPCWRCACPPPPRPPSSASLRAAARPCQPAPRSGRSHCLNIYNYLISELKIILWIST